MATGILNFIHSGFSTANNYRDSFQRSILFVTTEFFYTSNNSYNLRYPEPFIQARLKHLYRHGRTFSVPKTVFVVYKIARNPPVPSSRDIGKLMPATESKTELPRKIINGTVRLQFSKAQVSQQSEPHIHTPSTTLIL